MELYLQAQLHQAIILRISKNKFPKRTTQILSEKSSSILSSLILPAPLSQNRLWDPGAEECPYFAPVCLAASLSYTLCALFPPAKFPFPGGSRESQILHILPQYQSYPPAMSDILPIEYNSFLKSFYMISRLGFGSFGCAILAKYRKSMSELTAPGAHKIGTLLEPLEHNSKTKPHADGLVAIKVMKTQLRKPSDYLKVNEIRFILAVPAHQNLLQIFDLFIDTYNGKLNIVMEPMNQNLYQFMQKHEGRPLAPSVVKSMLAQLLNAIRHIHSHGYFHRDVKPENILVTSTRLYYSEDIPPEKAKDLFVLKLCDYGLSRHFSNTKELTQYVSTRWYRAPEILLRQRSYSQPIDIWAFGSVAVELVNLRPLFAGANEPDQIWQVLSKLGHPLYTDRKLEDLGGTWPEAVDLAEKLGFVIPFFAGDSVHNILRPSFNDLAPVVKACLMWDPEQRPTAAELCSESYFAGTTVAEPPQKPTVVLKSTVDPTNLDLHRRRGDSDLDSKLLQSHKNKRSGFLPILGSRNLRQDFFEGRSRKSVTHEARSEENEFRVVEFEPAHELSSLFRRNPLKILPLRQLSSQYESCHLPAETSFGSTEVLC